MKMEKPRLHTRKWYLRHWKIDPAKYSIPVCTTEPMYEEEDVEQGMLYELKESQCT